MLRRTPLRRQSKKGKEKQQQRKEQSSEDNKFYAEIWGERPHICYVTGRYLGNEALKNLFHHVLPKEDNKFPQYRYKKWNVILLSPEVHNQVEIDQNKVPKVKELYLELLEKHYNFAENQ